MFALYHLFVAESAGFEPARGFTPYLVSSEALSATQPTLPCSTGELAKKSAAPWNTRHRIAH